MKEHRRMTEENSFNKSLSQKYKGFLNKRNNLLNSSQCLELRFRLNDGELRVDELLLTLSLLCSLNYDPDGFTNLIFSEGIPK